MGTRGSKNSEDKTPLPTGATELYAKYSNIDRIDSENGLMEFFRDIHFNVENHEGFLVCYAMGVN
jgi:hypothetical protein